MNDLFNNREVAIMIWIFLLFCYMVLHSFKANNRDVWHAFIRLIKALFNTKLAIPTLIMLIYILGELYLFCKLGIWSFNYSSIKSVAIWILLYAIPETWNTIKLKNHFISFFKVKIKELIGVMIVIEYAMNSYSFSLFAELIIQAILIFFGMMLAYSEGFRWQHGNQYDAVENIIKKILTLCVLIMMSYSLWKIFRNPSYQLLIDFFIPIILSIGLIPFAFALNKYYIYDTNRLKKRCKNTNQL